jgi:hypothetical protein
MFYLIYVITNNSNGKTYTGAHTTTNIDDDYYGSGVAITRAIKKYGKQNFTKEIIHYCNTEDEMYKLEEQLVVVGDHTYNLTRGGNGGWSHVDTSGDNNPMRRSAETRKKVSESHKITRASNKEYYDSISIANFKIASEQNKGKKRPDHAEFMKTHMKKQWENNEYREKIKDKMSATYELTSPKGEIFITNRLTDFCEQYKLPHSTLWINSETGRISVKGRAKGWKCIKIKD